MPDQQDQRDPDVKADRQAHQSEAQHRPEGGSGQRQDDGHRQHPAFVKRDEEQIGEEQRNGEDDDLAAALSACCSDGPDQTRPKPVARLSAATRSTAPIAAPVLAPGAGS